MQYIYDGNKTKELVAKIIGEYIPAFCCMKEEIEERYQGILDII